MNLRINGESVQIPEEVTTVQDLLRHFSLAGKVVIVERNGEVLEKADHPRTRLADGDRIEIVHFVGGG
jgi:sulfur carrier protein